MKSFLQLFFLYHLYSRAVVRLVVRVCMLIIGKSAQENVRIADRLEITSAVYQCIGY